MGRKQTYQVKLSQEERDHLENLVSSGVESARKLTRCRILLKADEGWTDEAIADALDVGSATVGRVPGAPRARYCEADLSRAINRKRPDRKYERKIDGDVEAHLVAMVCGEPPAGQAEWSLRLLAERLVKLEQVELDSVSHETVRQALKKNALKPWRKQEWVIPPQQNAEFVCAMEAVLDLYHEPYDPQRPLVCFDEGTKQLIDEVKTPLPMQPGLPQRFDYEYERQGTVNLFVFFEPLQGWRHIEVTERRTMIDYAHCMQALVDDFYPDADVIRVVHDNLNTHKPASLYEAFPPAEAKRILARLEFHYTPKHGSWLNMAEIELNVLANQCLDRRIGDKEYLISEVAAWQAQRNQKAASTDWRFTTEDARIKLKHLYPSLDA